MSSKDNQLDKQTKEILEGLLKDLHHLKHYEQYDEKLQKQRQSKLKVLHNRDLTSQILDFVGHDIKKDVTEEKKKYRYESLKNMFEHHTPEWLTTRNLNYDSPNDFEYFTRERILGYYDEYKQLEREINDLQKRKDENRQMDLLQNISKYLEKKTKSKRGGVRRKQTKRKYYRKKSNK